MAMLRDGLLFWLALLELVAGLGRWRGLSWLGIRRQPALLAPLFLPALVGLRRRPAAAILALALALPLAIATHLAIASARNWALDPLCGLLPGRYADRDVTRLDIPLSEGAVPALHIVPRSGAWAAVCVAHGSGCDKTFYIWRLADALVQAGIAVLLIDLDGHGENLRVQRFPEMLDCVRGPVLWLRDRYERVVVVGYSLGACLAARVVADGLEVEGLVLLEGPPQLAFSRRDVLREGIMLLRPALWHATNDSSVFNIVRAWRTAPIRAAISTWDLIKACDLIGSVGRIRVPLLVAYGTNDAIVPPRQGEQVRQALPPHATFTWVPGASHLSLVLEPVLLRQLARWIHELP